MAGATHHVFGYIDEPIMVISFIGVVTTRCLRENCAGSSKLAAAASPPNRGRCLGFQVSISASQVQGAANPIQPVWLQHSSV
jgi:hypothetical protein